jgi:signal recognition particle subunit SRP72
LGRIPDASTKTVANNNSAVLKIESNPYLAQRITTLAPKEIPSSDRLFSYQALALKRNHYAIELQCQKFPGVKKSAARTLSHESIPAISPDKACLGVFRAAAHSRLQTGKEALHKILPLLEKNVDDVGLLLTVIQLYVQLSNPAPALTLLEAFFKRLESATTPDHADVRFAPGLVAVAVALYRLQRRPAAIRAELSKAAAHWQQREESADPSLVNSSDSLLRQAGIELLRSAKPEDLQTAGHAFERLVNSHPEDRTATAGLVASFAPTADFAKIQPHLDSLSSVEKLVGDVDVEALLEAGVAKIQATAPQGKKRALDAAAEKQQGQPPAKKKRRNKPAKNFEEGKTPDPERWLPLRDRSSYRPKGKKGKKRAAEATQGGVVRGAEEETLELAGGAGSVKVEKAPQGSGGGGAGKKKKKGKK